jgi:hypothetical protein
MSSAKWSVKGKYVIYLHMQGIAPIFVGQIKETQLGFKSVNPKYMERKLTNNRVRWYRHILRKKREPQRRFLKMKIKGKCPRQKPRIRWEQHVREDVTQKEDHGSKLWRKSWEKTEVDGDAWL